MCEREEGRGKREEGGIPKYIFLSLHSSTVTVLLFLRFHVDGYMGFGTEAFLKFLLYVGGTAVGIE